jgi:hypothetical protein
MMTSTPVDSIQPREVFSVARKSPVIEVEVENTEQIGLVLRGVK